MYETKIEQFNIRFAVESDLELIYEFVKELAKYEQVEDWVEATKESLHDSLFNRKTAEVIIGEYHGQAVSFAVFYHTFSTLVGKPGMHVDDIFVKEAYRGEGIGTTMLAFLAKLCKERNCGRFEWWCFHDNYPSLEFYDNIGGDRRKELVVYRVKDQQLDALAKRY